MSYDLKQRFFNAQRWSPGKECLNMKNINEFPPGYEDTQKSWIQGLTTFIYLYPQEWNSIYSEYLNIVHTKKIQGIHHLRFYPDDEGYIRIHDEQDIFLCINLSGDPETIKHCILTQKWEEFFTFSEYLEYTELKKPERTIYLNKLRDRLQSIINLYKGNIESFTLTFFSSPDGSRFIQQDIFIDPLNETYFIL